MCATSLLRSPTGRHKLTQLLPQDSEREAEKKQARAEQLEKKMEEMENAMVEMEQRWIFKVNPRMIGMSPSLILLYFLLICAGRLQNSEQQSKQSDQSDKDMRMELEGKVDALQKQLTDMDTVR